MERLKQKLYPLILILICIDQMIKLIISKYFISINLSIIDGILYLIPHQNLKSSWINSWLNLGIGNIPHIIFNFIIVFLLFYVFRYSCFKYKVPLILSYSYVLMFSGVLCSLIDKVFWGGSLDFIGLKGFFIFDFKDIYLTISEIILISYSVVYTINNPKKLKLNIKGDIAVIKDFFIFVRKDFTRLRKPRKTDICNYGHKKRR